MFWSSKPTISVDDEEWQLSAWEWLLENLGGVDALKAFPSKYPRHADFPKSGLSGHEHVFFVLSYLCQLLKLDVESFELRKQREAIEPHVGGLALVKNVPQDPGGTYRAAKNRHIITYKPAVARNLEQLIAVLIHELCHSVLFSIPTRPPDWAQNEEFVTDLATVFFGFGVFGGNQSFQFSQFRDTASGTQGWSTQRLGYLTQNEWGFALAVRALLTNEDVLPIKEYATSGLLANFTKNHRYLEKNDSKIEQLRGGH
ncbi:hypothetical protein QA646_11620 [Rhizobium sp. CB3090]|uniref:hypothetical protein n=1 Tax=Rhizobium sp. CB3090 TaxID=3039156 RepID=UPI0024B0EE63|nr:hypothetical protein [Rhizobium sp. CB3090]WFU07964.1 hypothetical protein QA646_11620 [Rhizobium sp. CB3090]